MKMNSDEKEVQEVLYSFLQAFENCDLPKMEYFFAEDAVMFPQVVMSSMVTDDIDPTEVLCTTYQMRNFYTQLGDGLVSPLVVPQHPPTMVTP